VKGDRLGPYSLEQSVGRGSSGVVWRAKNNRTGAPVAIKILHPLPGHDKQTFRRSFQREVRGVASLDHRGVVRIYDMGAVDGGQWFAMEWASGRTLHHWRPSNWATAQSAILEILDALAYVHARGLLHRDLKPSNIIRCGPADQRPGLKLADFGLVRAFGHTDGDTRAIGTPQYIAPEQVQDRRADQGPWTDLYALGCLAWTLLAGAPPFHEENPFEALNAHVYDPPPQFRPTISVPIGVEVWLRTLLMKRPEERFLFAADAAHALRNLGKTKGSTSIRSEWREPVRVERGTVPEPSLLPLRELPLVGREEARDRLWACLRDVEHTGRCRGIVLVGSPGIGKSRLARWLAERAHSLGAAFSLDGAGEGAAAMWSHFLGGATSGLGARIGSRLPGLSEDSARQLKNWLRGRPVENWRGVTLSALESLSSVRPVVVTLAPDELDPWVSTAVAKLEAPVLLALASEAEIPDGFEAIEIGPLSEAEHRSAVRALVQLRPPVIERLALRTDGNPGLTRLAVMHWAQIGVLQATDSGVYTVEDDETLPMPEELQTASRVRIDRILGPFPDDYRRAAELAAAFGHHVDQREWLTACESAKIACATELEDVLYSAGLAHQAPEDRRRWSWSDALIRAAVLDGADNAGRLSETYRQCAHAVEDRDEHAGRRGRLLHAAGDHAAAAGLLMRAHEHSFWQGKTGARHLHLELARRAAEAAALPPEDERWGPIRMTELASFPSDVDLNARFQELRDDGARFGWGECRRRTEIIFASWLWSKGRLPEAAAILDGVAADEDFPGASRRASIFRAWMHFNEGEADAVRPIADRLIADPARPADSGNGHLLHGIASYYTGDLSSAERSFTRAAEILEEAGIKSLLVHVYNGLGDVNRNRGKFAVAREMYGRSLEMLRFDHPYQIATVRLNLGLLGIESNEVPRARAELAKSRSMASDHELHVATCDVLLAWCDAIDGSWGAARRRLEAAQGTIRTHRAWEVDCAQSAHAIGDLAGGASQRELAREAWALAAEMWDGCGRPERATAAREAIAESA